MKINVRKFADRVGRIFGGKKSKTKTTSSVKKLKTKKDVKQRIKSKPTNSKSKKDAPIKPAPSIKKPIKSINSSVTPSTPSKIAKTPMSEKEIIERKVKLKNTILHNTLINQFLTTLAGEGSTKIVGELVEPMQDEEIAKKCKVKVTVVRSILNKLHAEGITEYSREKDLKTGWFSYMWKLRFDNMVEALKKKKSGEINSISSQLGEESGYMFYTCKKGCLKLPFDEAMESMFRCPTCNGLLYSANNKRKLKTLETKHSKLQEEIEKLESLSLKLKQ